LIVAGGDFYKGKKVLCFYSDDHGTTWQRSEVVPHTGKMSWASESKVAELPDGTLVLNSRTFVTGDSKQRLRTRAFSNDGGCTWSTLENDPALATVSCNGSLIAVPHERGQDGAVMLCSVPVGPGRTHGTVYVSLDGGRTWPLRKLIVPGEFAYSSLMELPDGMIGLFYEASGMLDINLVRFSMDWLLDGQAAEQPTVEELAFRFLPELPDPVGVAGPFVGVHGGALIVAGGANFPDKPLVDGGKKVWHAGIHVLEGRSTRWQAGFKLEGPRGYGATASLKAGILFAGGSDADQVFDDVRLLTWDRKSNQLAQHELPSLPTPLAKCGSAAIGNRVYVMGGKKSKEESDQVSDMWMLDMDKPEGERKWVARAPVPGPPRSNMVVTRQKYQGRDHLFLFAGLRRLPGKSGADSFQFQSDAYRYDPEVNRWTPIASLPVLKDPRNMPDEGRVVGSEASVTAGAAWGGNGDDIYIFSGTSGRYIFLPDGTQRAFEDRPYNLGRVLAYNVVSDTWRVAGEMPVGVLVSRAVPWNGLVVIPSGEVKPGIRTPRVQAARITPR
jgi:N-acetylneuraminic acid mutarotase